MLLGVLLSQRVTLSLDVYSLCNIIIKVINYQSADPVAPMNIAVRLSLTNFFVENLQRRF